MTQMDFEDIYYTVIGEMRPGYEVPGVENAFAPGENCARAQAEIGSACDSLRQRLGLEPGEMDEDLETILDAMNTIQRELCLRMFDLGLAKGRERRVRVRKRT